MKIKIDKILKTRKKTFAVEFTLKGELIVRAPKRAAKKHIHKILEENKDWILKKQREIQKKYNENVRKNFTENEEFFYLGKKYPVKFVSDPDIEISLKNNEIQISEEYKDYLKEILTEWYKFEARRIFNDRISYYSSRIGLKVNKVKLSSAVKRWGSCSGKGNINLVWRLVMAPIEIIDYVAVHELIHLEHPNHSKTYWKRVEEFFPNYRECIKWLEENGYKLNI